MQQGLDRSVDTAYIVLFSWKQSSQALDVMGYAYQVLYDMRVVAAAVVASVVA